MSVAANDDEQGGKKDDVTAGDNTNSATFSWSGSTLTVTGKGDLSKITVTDNNTKMFSATGAGKVYTKSTTKGEDGTETTTSTAVKQGDAYDVSTSYYEANVTYGDAITPSTTDYDHQQVYSMKTEVKDLLKDGQTLYSCAFYTGDNGKYAYVQLQNSTTVAAAQYSNWTNTQDINGTAYRYYCVVTGTAPKTYNNISLNSLKTDEYEIILLSDNNIDTYAPTLTTITAVAENLYSKDANSDEYVYHAKGSAWNYTEGQTLYQGTSSASDEAITDNAAYFGTTHSNYLESLTLPFVEYLPYAVGTSYSTVVFKTDADVEVGNDNSKRANINNEITRALVKISSIETLDLQDTYLESINAHDPAKQDASYKPIEDPTFYLGILGTYETPANTTLKTLYMPTTKPGSKLAKAISGNNTFYVFGFLRALTELHLGEGITTLGDYALYSNHNDVGSILSIITLPNTLETAETYCMQGQTGFETITFPKGMKTIAHRAFWGTNPKDVYFLGVDAPETSAYAWGESNYISNNSYTNDVTVGDTEETSITVKKAEGYAVRQNFMTSNGWYAYLHYPAACTKEQAARYTDITRDYEKVIYGVTNETFKAKYYDNNPQAVEYYYYAPGLEKETLYGKPKENGDAEITANLPAYTYFSNAYPPTTTDIYGGNYNGGLEDYYVGTQYIWPSVNQSQRATIVASNGLLWDGVTTIGQGIKNAGATDYDKDGSEYIGLHQFVFASGDVTTDKTDEWDVTKYADGKWHSICLPFHVTKAKMKETFGPNAEGEYNFRVCKFHKVDRTDDKLKLYFNNEFFENANDEDTVLTAHVSYMIKAKKENMVEGEKVMLKNYVLEAGSPVPTNVTVNAKSSGSEGETEANQYYFIGQYNSGVTIPQYSYFFSKSKGYFRFQAGTTAKWNGYTSVVEAPNGVADYNQYFKTGSDAKLSTIWDEDETTGIENVTIIAGDEIVYTSDNVYNLSGQLVSTKGMNGLPKGIYVQNGKKYIVK